MYIPPEVQRTAPPPTPKELEQWIPPTLIYDPEGAVMAYPEKTEQSIKNKKWGAWEGLREFYQNVLDEEEAVHGVPRIYLKLNSYGLWIWDYGRGVRAEDWFGRMGEDVEQRKNWWDRGRFGRGMKDGAAALILETGKPIYIWSKLGYVYTLYFGNWVFAGVSRRCLIVNARKGSFAMPIPNAGTVILVYGYRGDTFLDRFNIPQTGKKVLATINFEHGIRTSPEKPNSIIDEPEKRLYVRNIFVASMKDLFTYPSMFSYDLWWLELDEDRRTISHWDFERELGKLLVKLPTENRKLWNEILKNMVYECVESHARFTSYPLQDTREAVYESWLEVFGKNAICLSALESTFMSERLTYMGYTPIVIPWDSLREFLLACGVPSVATIVKERRELIAIPVKRLSPRGKLRLLLANDLAKALAESVEQLERTTLPKIQPAKLPVDSRTGRRALATYDHKTEDLFIDWIMLEYSPLPEFIGTLCHEFCHHFKKDDYDPPSRENLEFISSWIAMLVATDAKLRRRLLNIITASRAVRLVPSRRYSAELPLNFPEGEPDVDVLKRYIDRPCYGFLIFRDKEGYARTRNSKVATSLDELMDIRYRMSLADYIRQYGGEFKGGSLEVWVFVPSEDKYELTDNIKLL